MPSLQIQVVFYISFALMSIEEILFGGWGSEKKWVCQDLWNITSSSYLEMLLVNMIEFCFHFFSVIAMLDVASCNLWRLYQD